MRIILNSDVLHSKRLIANGLPAHIEGFCRDAVTAGAILVIPRTALLEDERHQQELVDQGIASVENAIRILSRFGVKLPSVEARSVVESGDLLEALRATGVQVEEEAPELIDYREAERRACGHLSPHPPDTKSDEMRDLVIWQVALRIAVRDGKAILVSRDEVHSHERGADEATAAGLLRARNFDEALDLIGRESPGGALTRSVLSLVWNELRAAGVPLPQVVAVRRVSNLAFVVDEAGHVSGTADFSLGVSSGAVAGTASIFQETPETIRADVTNLTVGGQPWQTGSLSVTAKGELPIAAEPARQRLDDLRDAIGDTE